MRASTGTINATLPRARAPPRLCSSSSQSDRRPRRRSRLDGAAQGALSRRMPRRSRPSPRPLLRHDARAASSAELERGGKEREKPPLLLLRSKCGCCGCCGCCCCCRLRALGVSISGQRQPTMLISAAPLSRERDHSGSLCCGCCCCWLLSGAPCSSSRQALLSGSPISTCQAATIALCLAFEGGRGAAPLRRRSCSCSCGLSRLE
jgi:hypothetical protein